MNKLTFIVMLLAVIWVMAIAIKRLSPNYIPRREVVCFTENFSVSHSEYILQWRRLAYELIPFWQSIRLVRKKQLYEVSMLADFDLRFKKNLDGIILNDEDLKNPVVERQEVKDFEVRFKKNPDGTERLTLNPIIEVSLLEDFELRFKKNPNGKGWIILNYKNLNERFTINGRPITRDNRVFDFDNETFSVQDRYGRPAKLYMK